MPRVVRISLYLLLLAGLPALLRAQEAQQQDMDAAARFLIEKITIEGIERGSARAIVTAETRLREGETYSEPALRQAIYRVKRLPFVLDAELSLRRGSERGAYELVITVEPTRPVFFLADAGGSIYPAEYDDRLQYSSSATVGVRQFLGQHGLMFASVGKNEGYAPVYQAGYTRYNPVGAGSHASVVLGWAQEDELVDFENTTAAVELGLPLAPNQSLRSSFSWARYVQESAVTFDQVYTFRDRSERWTAGLDWIYDTTDDPVFPSQGDKVSGIVEYSQGKSRREVRPFVPDFDTGSSDTGMALGAFGRRHVRLTPRQSVALGGDVIWRRDEGDPGSFTRRAWSAGLEGRHSLRLWGFEKTERIGDLRLESSLSAGYTWVSRYQGSGEEPGYGGATLATSVVFRNTWGILRASLYYSEDVF